MNIFHFKSGCFCIPDSEEMIKIMLASKIEFNNLKEFTRFCINKQWEWEKENNYTIQSLEERLKLFIFRDATHDEFERVRTYIKSMKFIDIQLEQAFKIITVFEPEFNNMAYVFESEYSFYFLEWFTSA